jgi:hypothetical protein
MDNSCEQIVRQEGVGWLFEKSVPPKGALLRGALGVRDEGLQDIHVYRSTGLSAIVVPNNDSFAKIGAGSVTIGLFLNLPEGSDNGDSHNLIDVANVLNFYEQGGDLIFRVKESGNDWVVLSTAGSGVNYCDGKTRYVKLYRDAHNQENKLGLKIYGGAEYERDLDTGFSLSFDSDLVIGAQDEGNGYGYAAATGTLMSGFYMVRDILTKGDDINFWLRGVPLVGTELFLKLDENYSAVVLDCSGYENHGTIVMYEDSCRGVHTNFFSWQNYYGYSADGDFLIPSMMVSTTKDIRGQELDFPGRVRMGVKVEDIACFQAEGLVWGRIQNPKRLHLRPGQDEFSIYGIFEKTEESSGVIMSVGTRYRLEWSGTGDLRITLGGTSTDVPVADGDHTYLINVGTAQANVWIDGLLVESIPVGTVYGGGGNGDFMGVDGGSILTGGSVTFLGVREGYMSVEEIDYWFTYVKPDGEFRVAYYFYSNTNWVFDISGYVNHMELYNYDKRVWQGRQSIMPYLMGGFTEVYRDRQDLLNPVVIPFDMFGQKIVWDIYGPGQVEIEYYDKGGLLVFDAYVNFNPENKVLGFWSEFWNKSKVDYWVNLDGRFYTEDVYKWNIQELNMDYFIQSLNDEAFNFVFSGSRSGDFGFTVEVVDLVLFNTENNIIYKPIPL